MKKNKLFALTALMTITAGLAACQGTASTQEFDVVPTTFDHYFSNKVNFADLGISVEGKYFVDDKIEKVVRNVNGVNKVGIKYVTDGDTAVFYTNGSEDGYTNPLGYSYNYFTCRFLAIDTPESTSSIAPWGKKASAYAKSLLENAEGIIVDATSIDTAGMTDDEMYSAGVRLDSNGTRWLGIVWYCPDGKDPENLENYRCYQLDMIEEGYSFYTGNYNAGVQGNKYVYTANKKDEPVLYSRYENTKGSLTLADLFLEADIRTKSLKERYNGQQKDPDYDYSTTPREMSITDAIAQYDDLSAHNTYIALTGVVTRFIGSNFYFQDENGTALYVYMGLDAVAIEEVVKLGETINIRGRLSMYGGQIQLTDIVWARETFINISKTDPENAIPMPEPIVITEKDFTLARLKELEGHLVTTELSIRSKGRTSKDNSYTLYANESVKDLVEAGAQYPDMSIRINGDLNPTYTPDEGEAMIGKTVTVTGIMGLYNEDDLTQDETYPSYQIVPGNRPIKVDEDGNYVVDENGNTVADTEIIVH